MTARIVDTDGVLDEASTGQDGNGTPIDGATPFVWGSVSKQLAAATVLGLERQGLVDDDAPVVEVVPQARNLVSDPAVTVGDLIHHTSGLPHDIAVTDDWTRRESATDAVASIPGVESVSARGTFRYSSLNYLLLQAVVEQVTDGSFADALDREVLQQAGASATIADPDEFVRVVPPGHVPFFGSAKSIDVGVDSAGLGYGYLAGSIEDLGRYASWRLGQLQEIEVADSEVDTGRGTAYGNGLFHETIGGQEVWWHSGAVPGYYTYVALAPESNKAMVLATNRYGELDADRVAALGRNFATLTLDGSTSKLPGSTAAAVLGVLLGIVTLVVASIVWTTIRLVKGRVKERSLAGAVVRIVATVALGGLVLVGAYLGVPALVGPSLPVMAVWAPDVTLMFWILLGVVFVAAALLVANLAVGYRKSGRS